VRLTIAAEVGADYFTLRQLDAQIAVLDRSVASFEKGLQLVENRQQGGVASGLDVAQEQTLLDGNAQPRQSCCASSALSMRMQSPY